MNFYRLRVRHSIDLEAADRATATIARQIKRHPDDIRPLRIRSGNILIGGLGLAAASQLQSRLRQIGCICVIEEDDSNAVARPRSVERFVEPGLMPWLFAVLLLMGLLVWLAL